MPSSMKERGKHQDMKEISSPTHTVLLAPFRNPTRGTLPSSAVRQFRNANHYQIY